MQRRMTQLIQGRDKKIQTNAGSGVAVKCKSGRTSLAGAESLRVKEIRLLRVVEGDRVRFLKSSSSSCPSRRLQVSQTRARLPILASGLSKNSLLVGPLQAVKFGLLLSDRQSLRPRVLFGSLLFDSQRPAWFSKHAERCCSELGAP